MAKRGELPSVTSTGLRLMVRRGGALEVFHGLWAGCVRAAGGPVSAQSMHAIGGSGRALEGVVLLDPRTDRVRAQWRAVDGVRAIAELPGARVLTIAGRSLVSRTVDGLDPRVHCRDWLDHGETIGGSLRADAEIAAVAAWGSGASCVRVCELATGVRRSIFERGAGASLAVMGVFDRAVLLVCDGDLFSVDAETGEQRWRRRDVWRLDRPSPLELCAVDRVADTKGDGVVICSGGGKSAMAARVHRKTGRVIERSTEPDDFFRFIGASRVLRATSAGAFEIVSLQSDASPLRWNVGAEQRAACWIDGDRWALVTDRYVCVIDGARAEVVAGDAFAEPLCDIASVASGEGWLAVSLGDDAIELAPLARDDGALPVVAPSKARGAARRSTR